MTQHESVTLLFPNTFTAMWNLFSKCQDDRQSYILLLSLFQHLGWATLPCGNIFIKNTYIAINCLP